MILGVVSLPMLCLGTLIPLVGFVCACLAPLLGIAALGTGYLAREQIKTSGEQGGSMALAGMIIGALQVALLLFSILLVVIVLLFGPSIGNVFSSINASLK